MEWSKKWKKWNCVGGKGRGGKMQNGIGEEREREEWYSRKRKVKDKRCRI